jgi:hypothetical protein
MEKSYLEKNSIEELNQLMKDLMNRNLFKKGDVELFKKLIFKCDLNVQNIDLETPIMYVLLNNMAYQIYFQADEIYDLLKKSDTTIINRDGESFLFTMLKQHHKNKLNLTTDQMYELLYSADMNQRNKNKTNLFYLTIMYASSLDFKFKNHQIKNLWFKLRGIRI